jgi:hypothetical protein
MPIDRDSYKRLAMQDVFRKLHNRRGYDFREVVPEQFAGPLNAIESIAQ